jgi:hypothetical protein
MKGEKKLPPIFLAILLLLIQTFFFSFSKIVPKGVRVENENIYIYSYSIYIHKQHFI